MDVTVTSSLSPVRANGGRVAVIITVATLRLCIWSAGITMSNWLSRLAIDCLVVRLRAESPVPARPVATP